VLVTTLTKRMAEDLTEYYQELGIKVRYLHSDIDTLERVEILRDLRKGAFDVLVGINLLREGLDLPEVSLVAILDADKEGFLRSARSLIQTIGRAARNVHGEVIMYADTITNAMKIAIDETERRRAIQEAYNAKHGITPATVKRAIHEMTPDAGTRDYVTVSAHKAEELVANTDDKDALLEALRSAMLEAAEALDFEKAAELRDRIRQIESGETITEITRARPVPKVRSEVRERSGSVARSRGGPRGRGRR
jgi:excinuclease ABC subunit B